MKRKGLTLIELLVVVAVLSILGVSLYTVFNSGVDAWDAAVERLEIYQTARFVLGQMSRELSSAFVGGGAMFTGADGVEGSGNRGDLIWFTMRHGDTIHTLLYSHDSWWKNQPDPILWRRSDEGTNISEDFVDIDLASNLSSIDFFYWNNGTRTSDWLTDTILPDAVDIEIGLVDSDGNAYQFETTVYLPNSETGG
jgi:prepilin-type N-terminal cleavage/methylation domain-containing protein